jgi:hypothetical protein
VGSSVRQTMRSGSLAIACASLSSAAGGALLEPAADHGFALAAERRHHQAAAERAVLHAEISRAAGVAAIAAC